MDQWEGTIISVPASKIQESLGLTNSLHDRDIWQLFLVSFLYLYSSSQYESGPDGISWQRVSKEFYETLPPDTSNTSWTVLKPEIKQRIRAQLGEYCREKGVFRDQQDVEPALEWRLYQLQRNRRAEMKKSSKPGRLVSFSLALNKSVGTNCSRPICSGRHNVGERCNVCAR